MSANAPYELRYERLREVARLLTAEIETERARAGELTPIILHGLRLTAITDEAIDAAYVWIGVEPCPHPECC